MSCRLLLIRHGQSEGNIRHFFTGRSNCPLTRLGEEQAEMVGEHLRSYRIDRIYASPLCRAYSTALPTAAYFGLEPITHDGLMEIFGGDWENHDFNTLADDFPEDFTVWKKDIGQSQTTNGESVRALYDRVFAALTEIAGCSDGLTVAVFSHATPIRAFFCNITGIGCEGMKDLPWPSNGSVSEAVYADGRFTSVRYSYDAFMKDKATSLPGNI